MILKSFHWDRHGDPTSHRASTEFEIKIGLRGLDGKFDENLSQLSEPEKYRAASSVKTRTLFGAPTRTEP